MRAGLRDFITGVVTLAGLLGLATLLMLFGEFDLFTGDRYALQVRFNETGGLREGSSVTLNGVPIGIVERIHLDGSNASHPIAATLRISESVVVPRPVVPRIESSLLGGSAILLLDASPEAFASGDVYPPDDPDPIVGNYRTMVEEMMSQLEGRMTPLLDSLGSFQEFADTYTELGRNLNDLVAVQTEEELAAGATPNLRASVVKLNAVLDDTREALQLASRWLDDEQLQMDVRTAVANANTLITTATETMARYGALADQLEQDADTLVASLLPVADDLSSTLAEVRRVAALAAGGKGTVGQLMTNPDLYNALLDAAQRLDQALGQVNLLIEKVKQEGLQVEF